MKASRRVCCVLFAIAMSGVPGFGTIAAAAMGPDANSGPPSGGRLEVAGHTVKRGLPVLHFGNYRGRRPRNIYFSGDAGNIVDQLRWSSWTSSHAAAHGWSVIQGCVPDCASGAQIRVPTSITLRTPVNGSFTRIIERRDGQDEVWVYTPRRSRGTWPWAERAPRPDGPVISLESYWGDIDTGAYASAWTYLAATTQNRAAFIQGEQAVRPSNIELLATLTGISGNRARIVVTRLLTHDKQYGCRAWSGRYEMVRTRGRWLIAKAGISPTAC